jgi:hypothetical protein
MGWEAQSVRLIPRAKLNKEITSPYDAPILAALAALKVAT